MSTIPPVPAGDPSFSPNPDIDLDLNAAAAAYAVDADMKLLVDDLIATNPKKSDILGGSERFGISKSEFAQVFRAWRELMARRNFDRRDV